MTSKHTSVLSLAREPLEKPLWASFFVSLDVSFLFSTYRLGGLFDEGRVL